MLTAKLLSDCAVQSAALPLDSALGRNSAWPSGQRRCRQLRSSDRTRRMERDGPYPQALDKGNLDDAFKIASTMAEMDGYAAAHLVSRMVYVLLDRAGQLVYGVTYMLYVWLCCDGYTCPRHCSCSPPSGSAASDSHGRTTHLDGRRRIRALAAPTSR